MAYLVDNALSFSTTGASSFALNMPQHATNDLLVALVGEDGVGTLAMTGWLQIGSTLNGSGGSHASALFYKVATSASETGTVTMGTVDAISTIVMSFRDIDVSTVATTQTSGDGATATITFANQGSTPYPAGTIVTVAGVTPTGYNGTYVSTGGSATTVTYANTTTGSQSVAGTVTAQIDNALTPTASAAASQYSSASITTNKNDALVLYMIAKNGVAPMVLSDPGPAMAVISSDSTGTTATTSVGTSAAWYIQRTAGASPTPSWTDDKSDVTNRYTISIRNKSGGSIPAYIDDVSSPGTVLTPLHHISAINGITYTTSLPYANIGPNGSGLTTTYDAATLTADYGINFFSSAVTTTPAATAVGASAGFVITFGSSKDLSTGFVVGSVIAINPKVANFFHGSVAQGGSWLSFGDASNNYRSYRVLAGDSKPNTEGRAVFSIQVGQSATQYGYSSSALSDTAVTTIMFLSNCPLATITLYLSELHLGRTHVVAGGDANNPVDTAGVAAVGKSFRLPVIQQTGASGLLSYVPIQIGGGDAVNFQIDAGSLQFPRRYNTTKKELNFHAADGAIGISYAGKSGDVIKHTNSVVSSPSSYYWEINSAATSAATWDFSGLTVVGAVVTLRNVTTFSGMTFSSCSSIAASSCTLDSCTFSNLPASNDTLTTNASTNIDNSTINVTGVTAGNRWCSVADPSIFSGCTFTGSGSSGHAIRITTAGTYAFSGNTFTGFGADGSTSAAIYNDSGGAATINITNGGSTPTYRNGTGASTTINNAVNITITVIDANNNPVPAAQVAVYKTSDNTELMNEDTETVTAGSFVTGTKYIIVTVGTTDFTAIGAASNAIGVVFTATGAGSGTGTASNGIATQSFNFISNTPIYVRVRKSSTSATKYVPVSTTGTITSAGYSLTATLTSDAIADPAL